MNTSSCACGRTIDTDRGDLACPTCQAMTCASCIERGQHECPEPARFVADDSADDIAFTGGEDEPLMDIHVLEAALDELEAKYTTGGAAHG